MKKKLLAAVISVIAAASVCTAFAVPAMAAINVYSPQGVAIICSISDPLVNKKPSNQLTGTQNEPGSNVITFTYSGSAKLINWSFVNGAGQEVSLASLSDSCRIISQDGNKLVIEITNLDTFQSPDGYTVNANVEVKAGESESTTGIPPSPDNTRNAYDAPARFLPLPGGKSPIPHARSHKRS